MEKILVLHFDINGTITAVDSTEVGNEHENTAMTISRSAYGKVVVGKWVLNDDYRDQNDSISYYDYLKSIGETNYKKISFKFCEKDQSGHQLRYLFRIVYSSMQNFIFCSFYKIIDKYPDARIVRRSFGKDINDVVDILQNKYLFVISKGKINKFLTVNQNNLAIQEDYEYWNSLFSKKLFHNFYWKGSFYRKLE